MKILVTENFYWKARRFEIKHKWFGFWWLTERLKTFRRKKYELTCWFAGEYIEDRIGSFYFKKQNEYNRLR